MTLHKLQLDCINLSPLVQREINSFHAVFSSANWVSTPTCDTLTALVSNICVRLDFTKVSTENIHGRITTLAVHGELECDSIPLLIGCVLNAIIDAMHTHNWQFIIVPPNSHSILASVVNKARYGTGLSCNSLNTQTGKFLFLVRDVRCGTKLMTLLINQYETIRDF